MAPDKNDRLSRIDTMWSVVRRAHVGQPDETRQAQEQLLLRYGRAIRSYLLGALRSEALADEVYQEFAFRFVKGDYTSADPERGRFRNFLKTILSRLVIEHYRKRKRRKSVPMGSALAEPAAIEDQSADDQFTSVWRDELLRRAWEALAQLEQDTNRPLHTVMDLRVHNPNLSSAELSKIVAVALNKPVSPANLRVILHRARDQFAQILLSEVSHTLDRPVRADVEDELIQLKLLQYCRPALERFGA